MLNANDVKGGGAAREVLPPGTYPARLVAVIDLGVQPQYSYEGKDKPPVRQFMLTYELLDEFMADEDGGPDETKPRWVSEMMPFYSLKADRANSTLRYLALDPLQEQGGDWEALLGTPCMVTLVINKKGYEKVDKVSAMRPKEAAKAPELVNEPYAFDFDNPDKATWDRLPPWIQRRLQEALNFEGSALDAFLDATSDGDDEESEVEVNPTKKVTKTPPKKKVIAAEPEEADEEEEDEEW